MLAVAVGRHAIAWAELELRRDVAHGSCDRCCEHAVEHRNRRCPGHHEKWPTADTFDLAPPDLASLRLAHHGSSAIASRIDAIAAARSAAVGGVCR